MPEPVARAVQIDLSYEHILFIRTVDNDVEDSSTCGISFPVLLTQLNEQLRTQVINTHVRIYLFNLHKTTRKKLEMI